MKMMRLGDPGAERPVLLKPDGTYRDLTGIIDDIDPAFFARNGLDEVRAADGADQLPVMNGTGLRVGAPVRRPSAIICIGMNYAAHATETGSEPPAEPIMFYKAPNTLVGPYDDVLLPRGADRVDWEVELAVVIGRRARYLDSVDDALDHIAGYAISNDVSERTFQLDRSGGQWSKGKSCETFNPLGPWLVTPDEAADPAGMRLRLTVNGQPRQNSNTADMIFSVAYLIHYLSQFTVLEPGDIVNTGTPQGVALSGRYPYLKAGDVVDLQVDSLGVQRQKVRCAAEPAY